MSDYPDPTLHSVLRQSAHLLKKSADTRARSHRLTLSVARVVRGGHPFAKRAAGPPCPHCHWAQSDIAPLTNERFQFLRCPSCGYNWFVGKPGPETPL